MKSDVDMSLFIPATLQLKWSIIYKIVINDVCIIIMNTWIKYSNIRITEKRIIKIKIFKLVSKCSNISKLELLSIKCI